VAGVGIAGRDNAYTYTVGFSNAQAQYWGSADPADGHFLVTGMLPGTYTMNIYKNELVVDTRSVTVTAGGATALNTITIAGDPSATTPVWRIGNWDGTPAEFLNGGRVTTMHPSDVRMSAWTPGDYTVGSSNPATGFPAYQWKDINGALAIKFNLSSGQVAPLTLRVGITTAYAGGRPKAQVNSWVSSNPAASTQPATRTLTVGSYRGNNTTYTFNIPASALVAGQNLLTLTAISGQTSTGYLSPGYSYDAIDLIPTP
jgi:rhamnogalacturonan endolyase